MKILFLPILAQSSSLSIFSSKTAPWDCSQGAAWVNQGSVGTVQEGDHLGTVALGAGGEVVCVHAIGDAVLNGPQDGVVEVVASLHISEGILGFHLDLM